MLKKIIIRNIIAILIIMFSLTKTALASEEPEWYWSLPVWSDYSNHQRARTKKGGVWRNWKSYWNSRQKSVFPLLYPPPGDYWSSISEERRDWVNGRWIYRDIQYPQYDMGSGWVGEVDRNQYYSPDPDYGTIKEETMSTKYGFHIPSELENDVHVIVVIKGYGYSRNITDFALRGDIPDEPILASPASVWLFGGGTYGLSSGVLYFDRGVLEPEQDDIIIEPIVIGPFEEREIIQSNGGRRVLIINTLAINKLYFVSIAKDVYSNPAFFSPSLGEKVKINYETIGVYAPDSIEIHAIDGQNIKSFTDIETSWEEIEWDGKDNEDNIVPKGIYTIRMELPINEYNDVSFSLYPYVEESPFIDESNDIATFKYKVWGWGTWGGHVPEKAEVYINLYDSEFNLIKRLVSDEKIPIGGEIQEVSWEYSAYDPGDYYYTIYSRVDFYQTQAKVGSFTIPSSHKPSGTRPPDPISDPALGWKNEGPIVRVCRPALVTYIDGTPISWSCKIEAERAAACLKSCGYKVKKTPVNSSIPNADMENWLKSSPVFFFSGHGMQGPAVDYVTIGNDMDGAQEWSLTASPSQSHKLHLSNSQTNFEVDPYKFVFLSACETTGHFEFSLLNGFTHYPCDSWKAAFKTDTLLGWSGTPYVADNYFWRTIYIGWGYDVISWTNNIWAYLTISGHTVGDAVNATANENSQWGYGSWNVNGFHVGKPRTFWGAAWEAHLLGNPNTRLK